MRIAETGIVPSNGGRRSASRSRGFTIILVALGTSLLLVSALVGTSSAHTVSHATSLSIDKIPSRATHPGDRVLIVGRLRPNACNAGQTIKLKRVRPGADSTLGTDKTDGNGEYRFGINPKGDMRVYTRFGGSVDSSYGHSHTCQKSTSARVLVNVT